MIKYAEFCAGIGGFRLGIEKSLLDAHLVYSNEIDPNCEVTYKTNFGQGFDSKNIFDINPALLPNFNLMCSGFPCQPFSQAGKELGFTDSRGAVFFKLLEIVQIKKPDIIFLENVPNLIKHNKGQTYNFIARSLQNEGYEIFAQVLDSTYFGVPQKRPRIYIIGLHKDKYKSKNFSFTKRITAQTALKPFLHPGDYSIPISKKWEDYIDLYTNKKSINDIFFPVPKTRIALERISDNCDVSDCVFQIRSSGIRAYSLNSPFPTFAVSNSGGGAMIPVLSKERRHLNLTEMRRIMGFPEWYDMSKVSRTNAIKQLANAVCPPVITSICNDLFAQVFSISRYFIKRSEMSSPVANTMEDV